MKESPPHRTPRDSNGVLCTTFLCHHTFRTLKVWLFPKIVSHIQSQTVSQSPDYNSQTMIPMKNHSPAAEFQ